MEEVVVYSNGCGYAGLSELTDWRLWETERWEALQRRADGPGAGCVVAVLASPTPADVEQLLGLSGRHPEIPVILVLEERSEAVRAFRRARMEEILWWSAPHGRLREAVSRAMGGAGLDRLRASLSRAEHLPVRLRRVLNRALSAPRPFPSVDALCRGTGYTYRQLQWMWSSVAGEVPETRLKALLQWILLVRAVSLKTKDRSWASVARELEVSRHTLWRTARALTGRTLRELAEGGRAELREAFTAYVTRVLSLRPEVPPS